MHNFVLSSLAIVVLCFPAKSSAIMSSSLYSNGQPVGSSTSCAQLSSLAADEATFRPSLVLDCFRDIPINKNLSVDLIEWIQNFVQFQTTLAWLKAPPPAYPRDPVDIVQSLDDIADRAANGTYANEFDFEVDVQAAMYSAADLHLSYQPYLPATLSGGSDRGVQLVSVSSDGQQLPEIYFLSDLEAVVKSNAAFTPSTVTFVDGQTPDTFFKHISKHNPTFTDYDAEYNALFANSVPIVMDTTGLFNAGFDPVLRDSTTYTFANGSEATVMNKISLPPFPGTFKSGRDLYTALLLKPISTTSGSNATTQTATPTSTTVAPTSKSLEPLYSGYPTPVIAQAVALEDQAISGYFLPRNDVAVLSITTMDFFGDNLNSEFQTVSERFLSMCKSSGKTRLIIDLRRNLGGDSAPAWDLFRRLFPGVVPFSSVRTRATAATNAFGIVTSQFQAGLPHSINASTEKLLATFNTSSFNYHTNLQSPDGPIFDSWSDLFGPITSHGDNFTNTAAELFSDPVYTELEYDMDIAGYANLSDIASSPFSADQITLLSDGFCSSACATFARLMIGQGVKAISVGGRPSKDSMAFIGGTQGSALWPFSGGEGIADLAQLAIGVAQANNLSVDLSQLQPLTRDTPIQASPLSRISINMYDNIGKDDESLTPLQFTRWLADCRMFYTSKDIFDVQHTWERVAQGVLSGGQGLCVQGSLTTSGGEEPVLNSAAPLLISQWIKTVSILALPLFLL